MSHISTPENSFPDKPALIDLSQVARELNLSVPVIEACVRLLDEGNTIPFITRFRKDLTGGLNEKQILEIKRVVAQQRTLADRKAFVLKSIEAQGALTDELRTQITQASNSRTLEDLYSPYKPQKQSRALVARQQGLEPLVEEILQATSADVDLASRATQFVRVDKGLNSVDDVIRGVTDLLVERFSSNNDAKNAIRQIMKKTGTMVSKGTQEPERDQDPRGETASSSSEQEKDAGIRPSDQRQSAASQAEAVAEIVAEDHSQPNADFSPGSEAQPDHAQPEIETRSTPSAIQAPSAAESVADTDIASANNQTTESITDVLESQPVDAVTESASEANSNSEISVADSAIAADLGSESITGVAETTDRKPKKKKKKKAAPDPFKDYQDFRQSLKNLTHHQYLAMCRGERVEKLKLKVLGDEAQLVETVEKAFVPQDHAFSEFLKKCAVEALNKVLLPSVEREIRRELTEAAEKHATEVFASNLRNLLLQPPLRNGRVLAIDPGFRSGCGVAVLDAFGNVLEHGQIYVVGNQKKRDESKAKIVDWVHRFKIEVIAIGTGAACRQAEQMISDLIQENLADSNVRYVMVNEAGASVYSISETGREELPDLPPAIRSAVSIGRRLQDPLSEFVKISPPNIGVGMYQHDVKAKHLVDSLDDIVELCVNQVGVNVNTASVSLLRFVSGLNALTARRLVEHRQKIGGFKNRQQLKEVAGIGDATFIQAAGFLRIHDGDNPLDSTSIHPESYPLAEKIIASAKTSLGELFPRNTLHSSAEKTLDQASAAAQGEATTHVETVTQISDVAEAADGSSIQSASEEISLSPLEQGGAGQVVTEAVAQPTNEVEHQPPSADSFESRKQALQRLAELDINSLAAELQAGKMLVRDILLALKKPSYDPRDRVAKPIFRRGILKIDDLKPEMQLEGQVVNVVDFGVFIDIGLGESSLVHVSQLSHRYVADPHRFYSVGDVMKVWVAEVDTARRRVKLTAIQPGSKPAPKHRSERGKRPPRQHQSETTQTSSDAVAPAKQPKQGRFGSTGFRNRSDNKTPERSGGGSPRFDRSKSKSKFEFNRDQGKDKTHRHGSRPPKPSKPAPPITDGMLKGSEPMRSFSDLLQFVKHKPQQDDEKN